MTSTIINAIISGLTTSLTPNPVYASHDQTKSAGSIQTVVTADNKAFARDAGGTPIAWEATVTATVISHMHSDKSGALRAAEAGKIESYFLGLTTLSGVTLASVTDVVAGEFSPLDENFGSVSVEATLIYT